MRSVRDIPLFMNVPVLVRASLNVPVEEASVVDDYRLRRAAPTIQFLSEKGARVVLISHLGESGTETLAPVSAALARLVPRVTFCPSTVGEAARKAVRELAPGSVLVLENLRRQVGERANDQAFARELAALADVFVQDSFDTCHRSHASIIGVPQLLPSYAGLLLEEEVSALRGALAPQAPSLAIIGGAKSDTKEILLPRLLASYSRVFVGGALANDFIKATGKEVGKSLVSSADPELLAKLLKQPNLILPIDSLVIPALIRGSLNVRAQARVRGDGEVLPNEIILDHGGATSELLATLVLKAKSILWNGPLGNYENGFVDATDALARAIASSGANSIVGGGDTIASIGKLGLMHKFSFVSTGGGAMLEFLAKGSLPGIDALG